MPKLPFARLPSAPPPGSSHFISNAIIIAKRVALNLEEPVRMHAGEWEEDHPVVHWYRRHRDSKIRCMQLRKEQKAPFFHEYITFRLDNGRCFRLDRRQLPDEQSPMDCAEAKGVEAYDTIEQITSLEDSAYNPSDSLVQLDFGEGLFVENFLMVLSPISGHSRARVYTVQRYNCYFYAQTVLLCTLCTNSGWGKEYLWRGEEWNADGAETIIGQMPLIELEKNPGTNIKLLVNQPEIEIPPMQTSGLTDPSQELTPPTERATVWGTALRFIWDKRKGSHSSAMQESTIGELQSYIWHMIHAHSIRVEQYKFLLSCSARDVERDIKTAMNELWPQVMSTRDFLDALHLTNQVSQNPNNHIRVQFNDNQEPSTQILRWYQQHQFKSIASMQLRKEPKAPFEYVILRLNDGSCFRLDRRQPPDERSLMNRAEAEGVEAYDTIEQITSLEDSTYNPSDSLVELDFREGVRFTPFLVLLHAISRHKKASVYTVQCYNSYFYARTVLLCTLCLGYGWDEAYLWADDWCLDNAEKCKTRIPLTELRENAGVTIKILDKQPDNPGDSLSGAMPESTIGNLQSYLLDMIHAHSVRVRQCKFLLRRNAEDVDRDIKTAMNEVWHQVISSCYIFRPHFITPQATLYPDTLVRIQFAGGIKPNAQLLAWYRSRRNPWVTSMQLRKERSPTFLHEYVAFKLHNGDCFRIDRRQSADEQSPVACVEDKSTEAYDTIEPITHLEDSKYNPSDCLVQLDFKAAVTFEMLFTILREISRHRQANGYTSKRYNSHFYARTVLLCALCFMYGSDQEHLWGADNQGLDKTEPPNSQAPLFEMMKQPGVDIRISDKQLDKPRDSQSGVMRESTIGDLQAYIRSMIHAHSVRVEQYKFVFGWSAEDIERDIKTAMNEVWHQVMSACYISNSHPAHQDIPDPFFLFLFLITVLVMELSPM